MIDKIANALPKLRSVLYLGIAISTVWMVVSGALVWLDPKSAAASVSSDDLARTVGGMSVMFGLSLPVFAVLARRAAAYSVERAAKYAAMREAERLSDLTMTLVEEERARMQEAWDREREAREDEVERWKADKIGELYDMILDQMHRGALGPGHIARPPWLPSNLPQESEDDGRSA